jgi:hypothetical protein
MLGMTLAFPASAIARKGHGFSRAENKPPKAYRSAEG